MAGLAVETAAVLAADAEVAGAEEVAGWVAAWAMEAAGLEGSAVAAAAGLEVPLAVVGHLVERAAAVAT